jgi:penicillin amidase
VAHSRYGAGRAGWAAMVRLGLVLALLGSAACEDTRTVDPVQSPKDVGPGPDTGLPVGGGGGAGGAGAGGGPMGGAVTPDAGPPEPDAAFCAPPAPAEPALPSGRCEALAPAGGGADPFAGLPCGDPLVLPGLDAPVQVVFTEMGIPHVYAASMTDAVRAQGYLIARDRFYEMDLTRRNTLGLLTGWLSQLALGTDIENRTFGQAQAARRVYEQASSPEMRALFDAYAEGVNFYIDRVIAGLDPRPEEFLVLGDIITQQNSEQMMPRWTGLDVAAGAAAITYALAFDGEDLGRSLALGEAERFGTGLPDEALRRAAATADIVGDLAPIKKVAQTVVGAQKPGDAAGTTGTSGLGVPRGLRAAAARLHGRIRGRKPDGDFGSNTWAVDAAHGRDGVAYLASDPHLALGAPTFFYQMHLDTTLMNPGADDRIRAAGVSLPGTPFVVIGHTDRIAWGITNLNADDTDFYLEKVTLTEGLPTSTEGPAGAVSAVVAVPEVYRVAGAPLAGVPAAFECTIPRYETADGRMLVNLEGTPVEGDVDCTAPPAGAVNIAGEWLVPGDVDADGIVSGISLDFTGLDPNPVAMTVEGFLRSQNIDDFMQAQRHSGVFNNAQAVADVEGNVATTGFHAVPKRGYLRGPDGGWAEGGNPTFLIDASRFPSFQVTIDADFRVVTDTGDPRSEMVGFDEWPRLVRPERGFVVSANNELTGGTFDADTGNETPYIGWNFDIGYRADRITGLLDAAVGAGPVGVDELARVQNDHRSNLAAHVLGRMRADLPDGTCAHPKAAEALARLDGWAMRGFEAASGVETFYHPVVDATEAEDAVATMVFNDWFAALLGAVLDDEGLDGIHWNGGGTDGRTRLLVHVIMAPETMAGFDAARADHVYWDDAGTPAAEARGEILCRALADALDHLSGDTGGGFGTADMNAWRWGMRHTVHFAHQFEPILGDDDVLGPLVAPFSIAPAALPVVGCVADDDPRLSLPGFPRPGDNFCVDASTAGWNRGDWSYDSGPVQRLIVRMENGRVQGEVVLPGGQSGFSGTAHWADQARKWLANERHPIHFENDDVAAHGRERLVLKPAP